MMKLLCREPEYRDQVSGYPNSRQHGEVVETTAAGPGHRKPAAAWRTVFEQAATL